MLLPTDFRNRYGEVIVPRRKKRSLLATAGLVGKVEIDSGMSQDDVHREICEVFGEPMGLSPEDIKNDRLFPFYYLQRAGAGSRSLCVPSVKDTFQWNGKQVASLAKAGSFIYLMARDNCQDGKEW